MSVKQKKLIAYLALSCLIVPMFASYFYDDMFSTVSHIFKFPQALEIGWDSRDLGNFVGDYSLLCVFGGLIVGGILLDILGIRITGTIFVTMMVAGAGLAYWGIAGGMPKEQAIAMGRIGKMFFGLGCEVTGLVVTRSIAKWFKDGNMSFAMGLELAVSRAGTAFALIAAPFIVGVPKEYYNIADTARPALVGMIMLIAGIVLWFIFAVLDKRFDAANGISSGRQSVKDEDKFSPKDIISLLKNPSFVMIGLLCVTFYCCVSSFKKFGTSVVIPRFGIEDSTAGLMVAMIPFFTIIFSPFFGVLVDKVGHATKWMILGALAVFAGHLSLAFAPGDIQFFGYAGIALLGFGYSLLPSAMFPSVPRIVPEKNLGTAYSLIYWIQNVGLFLVPKFVGSIFANNPGLDGVAQVEWLFLSLGSVAVVLSILLLRHSIAKHPELV